MTAPAQTSVALVHYPVYDKHRRTVASAITNLDLHDIARSVRTYGLANYYVVHPVAAQRELATSILKHWENGGATQNDFRREAIERVRIVATLEAATEDMTVKFGQKPAWTVTSAKPKTADELAPLVDYDPSRFPKQPILLIFGTGWGLTDEIMNQANVRLPPVAAHSDYNHLSVRSACAIILDRLYGDRQNGPLSPE